MKKIVTFIFIISSLFLFCNITTVTAKEVNLSHRVTLLRAGGGGSSSSGGSSGGSSGTHGTSRNYGPTSIISNILSYIIFIFIFCASAIVLYVKVVRASFNSKRYLKLLDDKDITWKYKTIEKQVVETFYVVQEAWTNNKIEQAKDYMDQDLYEQFKIKLEWMDMNHRRNVLKKIRLVNLKPVSVYDDKDDKKDLIWFYIKGKMIDYIVDTETNEMISGAKRNHSFIEFWKFVKNDKDRWVLSEILQEDESKKINFQ